MAIDLSTSGTKPTVVIVPGSFSPAYFYSAVNKGLSTHGYETITIDLPSVGRRETAPAATMADDAAHIRSVTSKLVDQGKDVVIVTHSYGGGPGTESTKGLAKSDREIAGERGGISRLIYLTSVVPPAGGSLKTEMGDSVMDTIRVNGDYMDHQPRSTLASIVFSDMPLSESIKWAEEMPEHSAPSFGGELTYPGYKFIPVSYIICEKDLCLTPEYQQKVVDMIKEAGGTVNVYKLDAGHCPNVSVPGEVVEIVRRALGEKV